MEATELMTLKQAETVVADWQGKLDQALADLAQFEQQAGKLALENGVDSAVEASTRLQIELKRAEAGLAAAHQQRDQVRRIEQVERAKRLREDAAALIAQAEEQSAIVSDLGPRVAAARNQMEHLVRRATMMEHQAEELEARYGKEEVS